MADKPLNSIGPRMEGAEFQRNPYPVYNLMRESYPTLWDAKRQRWLLARYDDVASTLLDPRFSSVRLSPGDDDVDPCLRSLYRRNSKKMIVTDAPDHNRLRALVSKAFTPSAIGQLHSRIEGIAEDLLDAVQGEKELDLIYSFAAPLPLFVVASLLEVPIQSYKKFKKWCDDTTNFFIGADPVFARQAELSMTEMDAYMAPILEDRRSRAGTDLISVLLRARERGEMLSDEELLANISLIINAGHETTRNLIGNGLLALLRHPDQLRRLREDSKLLHSMVEEVLRYDSPVQRVGRVAQEAVAVGNHIIRGGDLVVCIIGSANHDPTHFSEPGMFDIGRRDNKHLAFGLGAHFCLGAFLARMVGSVAFEAILRRFSTLTLIEGDLSWHTETLANRGLRSLRVVI